MPNNLESFGNTAKSLARNPLGIIALFIVLVYGFASLVTAFAGSFTAAERTPLVYFLVVFPVLVLGVFTWLVCRHPGKLFAPSDFKNDETYVRAINTAVWMAAASAKGQTDDSEVALSEIVEVVRAAAPGGAPTNEEWRNHILWVDDRPDNNRYERRAFETMGFRFTIVETTDDAIRELQRRRFSAVISDMGRREGPREGYVLLDKMRQTGNSTPLFIYAGSNSDEHKRETLLHGGQGCTNNAPELFRMVTQTLLTGSPN